MAIDTSNKGSSRFGPRRLAVALGLGLLAVALLLGAGRSIARGPAPPGFEPVDDADAQAILHHPMPQIKDASLQRTQLMAAPPLPSGIRGHRNIYAVYVLGRSSVAVARLEVWEGGFGQADGVPTQVRGQAMYVESHLASDRSTIVDYIWGSDGLSRLLTIDLLGGLTRADADRIAASVR